MTQPAETQPMSKLIHVLLLEDRATDAEMLIRELRRAGFDPQWKRVETEPDFLAELKNLPDIILSDYSMPQFNGLRAEAVRCTLCRSRNVKTPDAIWAEEPCVKNSRAHLRS